MTAFYAVRTTGIVCRRGCPSRAPRPENIVNFDDLGAAVAAGYRPCKRCRPESESPHEAFRTSTVRSAVLLLRQGYAVSDVAACLHVSERHLRRLVVQETGQSPRAWATA
ncbi:MAG: Ada metal-binding domain-containing protein [Candidatus Nanopelagicales bacterium]